MERQLGSAQTRSCQKKALMPMSMVSTEVFERDAVNAAPRLVWRGRSGLLLTQLSE